MAMTVLLVCSAYCFKVVCESERKDLKGRCGGGGGSAPIRVNGEKSCSLYTLAHEDGKERRGAPHPHEHALGVNGALIAS